MAHAAELHEPVLCDAVVRLLSPLAGTLIVDGTLGLGGHADALLKADPTVRLIGIDRDAEALDLAKERLAGYRDRFAAVHGDYRQLGEHLDSLGVDVVDGVLLDLGVSSLQLDVGERGFSFRQAGPLDMRMDRRASLTAADWLNSVDETQLAAVLFEYGEERFARRIARAIVEARQRERIASTDSLAAIVRRAVPANYDYRRIDPATRTFQAVRIAVNDELGALDTGLEASFQRLAIGGTLVVISFHSLEDRRVKHFLAAKARDCVCPPGLPECLCGKHVEANVLTSRPVTAPPEEVQRNPRARSAKLRAAVRLR